MSVYNAMCTVNGESNVYYKVLNLNDDGLEIWKLFQCFQKVFSRWAPLLDCWMDMMDIASLATWTHSETNRSRSHVWLANVSNVFRVASLPVGCKLRRCGFVGEGLSPRSEERRVG